MNEFLGDHDYLGVVIATIVAVIGYVIANRKQKLKTIDGQTLNKLEEAGIDITQDRELEFWFFSDEKTGIDSVADELKLQDFQVYVTESDDDPQYIIRALKSMPPQLHRLIKYRKEFNELAKTHDAVYDGWGCSNCILFDTDAKLSM